MPAAITLTTRGAVTIIGRQFTYLVRPLTVLGARQPLCAHTSFHAMLAPGQVIINRIGDIILRWAAYGSPAAIIRKMIIKSHTDNIHARQFSAESSLHLCLFSVVHET